VNEATSARAAVDMEAFGLKGVKTMLGGWNEWVARKEKIEK
jgi:3-mercaptopyruvate sulfurtransferase SseA